MALIAEYACVVCGAYYPLRDVNGVWLCDYHSEPAYVPLTSGAMKRKKATVDVSGLDKVREAAQRLSEQSPKLIADALRKVADDIQENLTHKETSS